MTAVLAEQASMLVAAAGCTVALSAVFGIVTARGSTAVPAAAWAILAGLLAVVWACNGGASTEDLAASAAGRLVVGALAVCPAMSILGAKRPQHAVWQVIVGSLACVLVMPALIAWTVRPGGLPDVHLVGRIFLVVLAMAGWLNFLGTRKAVAATLVTVGLLAFLRPFLPWVETAAALRMPWADALAGITVTAGSIGAVLSSTRRCASTRTMSTVSDPFVALRETLGAAWALRIAERFDRVAEERGWPCRLQLAGLDTGGADDDDSWQTDAVNCFDSIARRFVSRDWLVRHGGRQA